MIEHKYPRRFKPRGVLTPGFVYAEVSEPGGALIAHCANGTSHQWGNSDTEAEAEHRMQVYENWHNCETFDHEPTAQLSPPDTLAAAAKLLTDMAEAFRTGHTIYPTSDYATSVAEIADRLAAQLSPPDDLAAAAEAMLKIVHEAIDDLGAKSHCHDVQAKLAFHGQALAAALEKRGR